MHPMTRAELITHIRATAERMAQTALLMQYYGGLGEIAKHGRDMEGASNIVRGWAAGIEADGRPVFTKHEQPPTNEPQGPQTAGLFHGENMTDPQALKLRIADLKARNESAGQRIAELQTQIEAISAERRRPKKHQTNPEKWVSAVTQWHRTAKRLEFTFAQWSKANKLPQPDFEAGLQQVVFDNARDWAQLLQTTYGLGGWLEYWLDECKFSASPAPVTINGQEFALDGLDSLIELLRAHRAMKEGKA